MKKLGLRLSSTYKSLMYVIFLVLFVTGGIWLYEAYFMKALDPYTPASHELGQSAMKIHGGFSMFFLIMFGMLLATHIPYGIKSKKNFYSGMAMVTITFILSVTGYLLYYVSSENIRDYASIIHSIFGIVIPLVLVFHSRRNFLILRRYV